METGQPYGEPVLASDACDFYQKAMAGLTSYGVVRSPGTANALVCEVVATKERVPMYFKDGKASLDPL